MYSLQVEKLQNQMEQDYEIGSVDYFFFACMVPLIFIHFCLDLCSNKFPFFSCIISCLYLDQKSELMWCFVLSFAAQ